MYVYYSRHISKDFKKLKPNKVSNFFLNRCPSRLLWASLRDANEFIKKNVLWWEEFSKTSQNLSSFRQLLFSSIHRVDQRKTPKNQCMASAGSSWCFDFFTLVPLWNEEHKSCLNELKFFRKSQIKHLLKISPV